MTPCWHEELCECGDVRAAHLGPTGLGGCVVRNCDCIAFKRAACAWCDQIRQDSVEVTQ